MIINPLIMKKMIDLLHPVGEYYETSNLNFNPNITWGGSWNLENDGTILVSYSDSNDSFFNKEINTIVGEEKHTLKRAELPNERISVFTGSGSGGSDIVIPSQAAVSNMNTGVRIGLTDPLGSGYAHNNIQPSKIVNRWHRIS